MILFPNAKINLGLNIIRKRPDGYHDLETVFCPVNLCDALEILPLRDQEKVSEKVTLVCSGIPVDGNPQDNICTKAWHLLAKDFPGLPPVQIHLHKVIPTGAGLGGGSSDAAFTLKMLNRLFQLRIQEEQLSDYALQLGSDCPFFLMNQPCFAEGRGEMLEPVTTDLSGMEILLVHPGIHISTASAFKGIEPARPEKSIKELIQQPVESWKKLLCNDFEKTVFPQYPDIRLIRDRLYEAGALYASLTGSGSAVYGIFEKNHVPNLSFPDSYSVFSLKAAIR